MAVAGLTRKDHRLARVEAPHFTVTTNVRRLLAPWGGNASRVHAKLVQRAIDDPDASAVPSLSTLHRAIRRDLTRGERAGLRSGEAARGAHDVFGQQPATHSRCPSAPSRGRISSRWPHRHRGSLTIGEVLAVLQHHEQ